LDTNDQPENSTGVYLIMVQDKIKHQFIN